MSDEVKNVTDTVRQIAEVKEAAKQTAANLKKSIDEINEGLAQVNGLAKSLSEVGVELRSVLAPTTNAPPDTTESPPPPKK